ncbi:MAG TPA: DUF116 domain-containing protein [Prolixibacteraceae bacterium]|nr:DUF116 domain-containing protein [Prolixibacteraceae bacterium]
MNATFPQPGALLRPLSCFPTYNLKENNEAAPDFYSELEYVSGKVLAVGSDHFGNDIRCFLKQMSIPVLNQTESECLFDILMIGTFWNHYQGKWRWDSPFTQPLFHALIVMRKTALKKQADWLRGKLTGRLLDREAKKVHPFDLENFQKLISWLSATGEYPNETRVLHRWLNALYNGIGRDAYEFLAEASAYAVWFDDYARKHLGAYTRGVESFLATHREKYREREDRLFCGRPQAEYFLNMVGAEIMNQAQRQAFLNTRKKIVLLPTCLASRSDCPTKHGSACLHCTAGCSLSKTIGELQKIGIETVTIHHNSDYAKRLKPWANQSHTGIVGTACVLNLLSGGYEMKKRNIPSQCAYLDFSGCKRHWTKNGIPTELSLSRIIHLLNPQEKENQKSEQLRMKPIFNRKTTVA